MNNNIIIVIWNLLIVSSDLLHNWEDFKTKKIWTMFFKNLKGFSAIWYPWFERWDNSLKELLKRCRWKYLSHYWLLFFCEIISYLASKIQMQGFSEVLMPPRTSFLGTMTYLWNFQTETRERIFIAKVEKFWYPWSIF